MFIDDGFPPSRDCLKPELKPFWGLKDDLSTEHGIPMFRGRPILPVPCGICGKHEGLRDMQSDRTVAIKTAANHTSSAGVPLPTRGDGLYAA